MAHAGTAGAVAAPPRHLRRRPLWRKQEIVRQERIVHYTTVDENGQVQALVETERSSTEVTHMECNDTGEFAHREASEYEQLETFNRQVFALNQGNEKYVHLKSADDEVEFMESNNMPNSRHQQQGADSPAAARDVPPMAQCDDNEDAQVGGSAGAPRLGPDARLGLAPPLSLTTNRYNEEA